MTGTKRIAAALAAASVLTAGITVLGGGAAHASKNDFTTKCKYLSDTKEWEAIAYNTDGNYVGLALFDQDPMYGHPGDALYATDAYADGWGVIAHLSTGRTASTVGHSAGYTTPAVTGNLPEGHTYSMWVEMEKDGTYIALPNCKAMS